MRAAKSVALCCRHRRRPFGRNSPALRSRAECPSEDAEWDAVANSQRRMFTIAQDGGDVVESAPATMSVEIAEVDVAVERGGGLVNGVEDHGPGSEVSPSPDAAAEGIHLQVPA